jgi:hypothetical protein
MNIVELPTAERSAMSTPTLVSTVAEVRKAMAALMATSAPPSTSTSVIVQSVSPIRIAAKWTAVRSATPTLASTVAEARKAMAALMATSVHRRIRA